MRNDRNGWGALLLTSIIFFVGVLAFAKWDRMLGLAPDPGVGGEHAFLQTQPGDPDEPVAWDPCREIHYVVNPDGGPDNAVELVQEVADEVSELTGLQFAFDGETDQRPDLDDRSAFGRPPSLISWADEDEVPRLDGEVVGLGGASAIGVAGGRLTYVTGFVIVDTDLDGGDYAQRSVLRHEFGHLVGLDHVDDPGEIMFDSGSYSGKFGPGDREGLALLGRGACQ